MLFQINELTFKSVNRISSLNKEHTTWPHEKVVFNYKYWRLSIWPVVLSEMEWLNNDPT